MNKEETLSKLQKENRHSIPTFKAMDAWAKEFALWLSENTTVIYEGGMALYRYTDRNNECGNYILDDIYTVFEDEMNK